MKTIYLPWLDKSATVGDAISRLIAAHETTDATAIVTTRDDQPVILKADDLVQLAETDSSRPLRDVAVTAHGATLTGVRLDSLLEGSMSGVMPELLRTQAQFGILPIGEEFVHVVTKRESDAALYVGALDICQCRGPKKHVTLRGKIRNPPQCNNCSFRVDCG